MRLVDPGHVFFDANGVIAGGGSVTFFDDGTTTLRTTYSDDDLTTANPNPMTIGATGRLARPAFGSGRYTMLVKDGNGALILTADAVIPEERLSRTAAAGDSTPNVAGATTLVTANTSVTVITGFDGGRPGQELQVIVNDIYTIFDCTGTTLKTPGGEDLIALSGQVFTFTFDGINWHCEPPSTLIGVQRPVSSIARGVRFQQQNDWQQFGSGSYTITTTEDGSGNASEAVGDGRLGELVITNDDAADDLDIVQWTNETFLLATGKPALFRCRVKFSDVAGVRGYFGLNRRGAITTSLTTDRATFILNTNEAGWSSGSVGMAVAKNGTQTRSSELAIMENGRYQDFMWFFNGSDGFYLFVDGEYVETIVATNLPDDEELTPSFAIHNLTAAANSMTVDYYWAELER